MFKFRNGSQQNTILYKTRAPKYIIKIFKHRLT